MSSIRYTGTFSSKAGVEYRCDILYTKNDIVYTPETVVFGSDPLNISWPEKDKIEPVKTSSATLVLESTSDRKFIDLYTVEPGAYRLDVYRNSLLYWRGTLDTEIYEEPYATNDGYDVTFTFSDFAILERTKWTLAGRQTMQNVINACIAKICDLGTDAFVLTKYISTLQSSGAALDMTALYLNCSNFFDEEGEAMTVKEVLSAVLQPFALNIIQRAGKLYLYDLNAIYALNKSNVSWASDDSTLGVDVVYNNVEISFSPYIQPDICKGEVETTDDELDYNSSDTFSVNVNLEAASPLGFKITWGNRTQGSGLTLSGGAVFCKESSYYSGSDESFVLWSTVALNGTISGLSASYVNALRKPNQLANCCSLSSNINVVLTDVTASCSEIIRTEKVYVATLPSSDSSKYRIKVNLNLLLDTRYNPFEDSKDNEESASKKLANANIVLVPVKIQLYDDSGNVIYHLRNNLYDNSYSYMQRGTWMSGSASWKDCYLAYYDYDDRKNKAGVGGAWQTNKQYIGLTTVNLPDQLSKRGDGEFIPMPPAGGYIELQIGSGVLLLSYSRYLIGSGFDCINDSLMPLLRWLAYKTPSMSIVTGFGKEVKAEDQVDTAVILAAAKESLSIDTKLGTMKAPASIARALIFDANGKPVSSFMRQGVTDRLERLLIGTVYSQYASRKTILSGTVDQLSDFIVLGDAATSGQFLILADEQDMIEDESNVVMVQFDQDQYVAEE
jgi:hypothetical protein